MVCHLNGTNWKLGYSGEPQSGYQGHSRQWAMLSSGGGGEPEEPAHPQRLTNDLGTTWGLTQRHHRKLLVAAEPPTFQIPPGGFPGTIPPGPQSYPSGPLGYPLGTPGPPAMGAPPGPQSYPPGPFGYPPGPLGNLSGTLAMGAPPGPQGYPPGPQGALAGPPPGALAGLFSAANLSGLLTNVKANFRLTGADAVPMTQGTLIFKFLCHFWKEFHFLAFDSCRAATYRKCQNYLPPREALKGWIDSVRTLSKPPYIYFALCCCSRLSCGQAGT